MDWLTLIFLYGDISTTGVIMLGGLVLLERLERIFKWEV